MGISRSLPQAQHVAFCTSFINNSQRLWYTHAEQTRPCRSGGRPVLRSDDATGPSWCACSRIPNIDYTHGRSKTRTHFSVRVRFRARHRDRVIILQGVVCSARLKDKGGISTTAVESKKKEREKEREKRKENSNPCRKRTKNEEHGQRITVSRGAHTRPILTHLVLSACEMLSETAQGAALSASRRCGLRGRRLLVVATVVAGHLLCGEKRLFEGTLGVIRAGAADVRGLARRHVVLRVVIVGSYRRRPLKIMTKR